MRWLLLALSLLALAACGGSGSTPAGVPDVRFGEAPYAAIDLAGVPVDGPADAWVTIVEFLDYSCPYCASAWPTVHALRAAHPADVRVAVKLYPLVALHGEGALRAARAAVCAAEQGLFWQMHDALFEHATAFSDAQVAGYAAGIGADMTAWQTCYGSQGSLDAVNADLALGQAIGVLGTPTFVIDGKQVAGAYPFEVMDELVNQAQAAAEASGVPRDRYYDHVILGLP